MTQLLPFLKIVLVDTINIIELLNEGIFEVLVCSLSGGVVTVPVILVAQTVEFVRSGLCGVVVEPRVV